MFLYPSFVPFFFFSLPPFFFFLLFCAVNQGHCHPKIIKALVDQAHKLTLSSRAFHNSLLGEYEKFVCEYFGYERMLPMNTGVEAWETGLKLARRWGYAIKKIPDNKVKMRRKKKKEK